MQLTNSGFRTLRPDELEAVAGSGSSSSYRDGDRVITDYFDSSDKYIGTSYANDDGSGKWYAVDGRSGSWGGDTGYWSIGGALGIGFGLWGTSNGDWGIAWNVGVGGYVLTGEADSAGAAIQEATEERIVIGVNIDNVPTQIEVDPRTGEVTYPDVGFSFGFFGTSPDPAGPPKQHEPILVHQQ